MFGYIRPMQGELKVRELERFKACYCGLCHALGRKYGLAARFILSYELVFLSMLIWDDAEAPLIKRKRCIASPFCKRRYCTVSKSLELCAGYSVILTWWKMLDALADETFLRSIPHRFVSLFLSRAYRKAARELPKFDDAVRSHLADLADYEARRIGSIDEAADKFAKILTATAEESKKESTQRALDELLYHLGRWIYIMDACDDLKDDVKYGRYNPVALRFQIDSGALSDESKERVKATLAHSNNLLSAAFELLPKNAWTGILGNMIYLGMPDACERVLEGHASCEG